MKTPSSLRRNKVIEDGKDSRDQLAAQNGVATSIAALGPKIDDVQTSVELTAETVESKGNEIISVIQDLDTTVGDVEAGVELTAENTEKANTHLKDISEKLAAFSDMLKEKISGVTPDLPAVLNPSASDASSTIDEEVPVIADPGPELEDLIRTLIPDPTGPTDSDVLPDPPSEDEKSKEETKLDKILAQLGELNKSVAGGFKQSIAFSDRIASMLFKYTLTAIANAAKTAAIILSIILGIDLILIHFKYWSAQLDKGIENLQDKMGALTEPFLSMKGAIDKFVLSWEKGDWVKMLVDLLKDSLRFADDLAEAILYGMGKLTATLLRAMGKEDWADSVTKLSAERYSAISGHIATDEEQEAINRVKARNFDKDKVADQEVGGRLKFQIGGQDLASLRALQNPQDTDEGNEQEFNKELRKLVDKEDLDMSKEGIAKMVKTETDAEMKLNSVKHNTERFSSSPEKLDELQKTLDEVKADLAATKLPTKSSENLQKQINENQANLNRYRNPEVKPQPAAEKEEAIKTQQVEQLKAAEKQSSTAAPGGSNINVNNVKSTKTTNVSMGRPRTSIDDPGMGSSRTV